jgi:hypothetical protein
MSLLQKYYELLLFFWSALGPIYLFLNAREKDRCCLDTLWATSFLSVHSRPKTCITGTNFQSVSGQQQDFSGQQQDVSGQQQDFSGQQQDVSGQNPDTSCSGKWAVRFLQKKKYAVCLYCLQIKIKRTPPLPTVTKFDLVPYMGNVIGKDH